MRQGKPVGQAAVDFIARHRATTNALSPMAGQQGGIWQHRRKDALGQKIKRRLIEVISHFTQDDQVELLFRPLLRYPRATHFHMPKVGGSLACHLHCFERAVRYQEAIATWCERKREFRIRTTWFVRGAKTWRRQGR